jgi:hypothetical protein
LVGPGRFGVRLFACLVKVRDFCRYRRQRLSPWFFRYSPVVDSAPANYRGGTSKLIVRGLNEDGQELDNFTLARRSKSF